MGRHRDRFAGAVSTVAEPGTAGASRNPRGLAACGPVCRRATRPGTGRALLVPAAQAAVAALGVGSPGGAGAGLHRDHHDPPPGILAPSLRTDHEEPPAAGPTIAAMDAGPPCRRAALT